MPSARVAAGAGEPQVHPWRGDEGLSFLWVSKAHFMTHDHFLVPGLKSDHSQLEQITHLGQVGTWAP